MSEQGPLSVTALGGASFDGFVRVEEMPVQGMITLRGDLAAPALKNVVTGVTGTDMPDLRGARVKGEKGALWMSPDEILLLVPHAEVATALRQIEKTMARAHHLAVDVSDARAMFRLSGDGARDVVSKLAPVDMAQGTFGPGQVRRTRLAQVAAAIWMRDDETVEILCFRSVARYVFDLLCDAARPGSELNRA